MADAGCARPTGATVSGQKPKTTTPSPTINQEAQMIQAQVGKAAPDFTAPAYHQGKFTSVKLSDYLGKWTLLCFYPGDFTYV